VNWHNWYKWVIDHFGRCHYCRRVLTSVNSTPRSRDGYQCEACWHSPPGMIDRLLGHLDDRFEESVQSSERLSEERRWPSNPLASGFGKEEILRVEDWSPELEARRQKEDEDEG